MKLFAILVILLSGFYIGTTKIILSELKDLEDFYANTDQIAASAAGGQDISPYAKSLQNNYGVKVGR
jgi:hypothetical protein